MMVFFKYEIVELATLIELEFVQFYFEFQIQIYCM